VAAGTYGAIVTYVNPAGETVGSTAGTVTTTTGTSTITVPPPAASGTATGWYAYVTQPGGSTYYRQQAAGSPTAIGTNLTLTAPPTTTGAQPPASNTTGPATGTTYTALVPGVSLVLTGTLTTNDSATFTTDVTMLAFTGVTLGYSSGGTSGISYQSPVLDSGDSATQWYSAEWTQGTVNALSSLTWKTGQTPTPDASWSTTTVTPTNTTLPDSQVPMGVAGLMLAPRGRYAQFTANFAIGTTAPPFIRDLVLYSWVPERDPQFLSKMAFGESWQPGPTMTAFFGALSCELATERQKALDYVNAFGFATAVDQYLQAYLSDFGLSQYTGEPQSSARQRLLAVRRSDPNSGSLVSLQEAAALLTGFAQSAIGAATLTGAYQFQLTIPPPVAGPQGTYYPNLPGVPVALAKTIVTDMLTRLTPVTNILSVVYQ
jgi:hypothetical protein